MTTSPRVFRRAPLKGARERGQRRDSDRRAVWRRGILRKSAAAVLLGGAVYAGTSAASPDPPDPGHLVLVAGSDLAVGQELTATSVRGVHVPADLVPDGALTDPGLVAGAVTTAPLRAGEILTDLRLSAPATMEGLDPDLVMAHLPLHDPDLAGVLQPGTRVDVLATTDGGVLAADVLLLRRVVPGDGAGVVGPTGSVSFLVAVTPEQAGRLAAAAGADLPGQGLTVVIRR